MVILVFYSVEEEEQVEEIKEDAEEAVAEGMQWYSAKSVLGDTFFLGGGDGYDSMLFYNAEMYEIYSYIFIKLHSCI